MKLIAVTRQAYYAPLQSLHLRSAYDAHVMGSIAKIERGGRGRAIITIINECCRNFVEAVELDVPIHPRIVLFPTALDDDTISAGEDQLDLLRFNIAPELDGVDICRGLACRQTAHEVADARIGVEIVELTDVEEEETPIRARKRRSDKVAPWRAKKNRGRKVSGRPSPAH